MARQKQMTKKAAGEAKVQARKAAPSSAKGSRKRRNNAKKSSKSKEAQAARDHEEEEEDDDDDNKDEEKRVREEMDEDEEEEEQEKEEGKSAASDNPPRGSTEREDAEEVTATLSEVLLQNKVHTQVRKPSHNHLWMDLGRQVACVVCALKKKATKAPARAHNASQYCIGCSRPEFNYFFTACNVVRSGEVMNCQGLAHNFKE